MDAYKVLTNTRTKTIAEYGLVEVASYSCVKTGIGLHDRAPSPPGSLYDIGVCLFPFPSPKEVRFRYLGARAYDPTPEEGSCVLCEYVHTCMHGGRWYQSSGITQICTIGV
ncbi:hypothetical protein PISMIDRAFT_443563 [Pisolithus microcarpus 441]|uniref:Uncharacterized protein n=1 Tax=Pisolithus microcarpus 441 TaxID=765257 RepID=A0A0C9YXJ0_9AGAM|nr:hypothetical protein PISMIDRAFT_443563 [Pisolithus microcarpus 441]